METTRKEQYESPMAIVMELKYEGVICTSGGVSGIPGYPSGGDPFNPVP